jgi:hypothetical protein
LKNPASSGRREVEFMEAMVVDIELLRVEGMAAFARNYRPTSLECAIPMLVRARADTHPLRRNVGRERSLN